MRKVILELITSLDGFIEGVNGEIDWIPFDEEAANYLNGFADEIDSILYGRTSFEMYGRHENPDTTMEAESSLWSKLKSKKKYVFTTDESRIFEDATTVSGDIKEAVHKIKQEPGKNIWLFGGASLTESFLKNNLIDEYRISIAPVLLGSGKPLFSSTHDRISLKLLRTYASKSGVVSYHYERIFS